MNLIRRDASKTLCLFMILSTLSTSTVHGKVINFIHTQIKQQDPQQQAKIMIIKLYRDLTKTSKLTMVERLDIISAQFLDFPYLPGALGEGEQAYYDQSPLYRTESFDCETFVDTVLALALANTFDVFEENLRKIRYWRGVVRFTTRNHFTALDWNT